MESIERSNFPARSLSDFQELNQVTKVVEQGEKEKKVLQSQLFNLEIVSEID